MAECAESSSIADDFELLSLSDEDESSSMGSPVTPTGRSPMYENEHDYLMDHTNRGKCVVFNHEFFTDDLNQRRGTHYDVQRINETFRNLGFTVEVYDDYVHNEIKNKIKELSEEDHTDNDCLVIFVLTHGEDQSKIHAKNIAYDMRDLWRPFTANKCITLAGKPKLFFFSACRGRRRDSGVILETIDRTETDSPRTSYVIPAEGDFLYGFSTPPGYVSHREPSDGTWYVKILCSVLDRYAATSELLEILTITNREMSDLADETAQPPRKQVPEFYSRLSRRVYFKPKKRTE